MERISEYDLQEICKFLSYTSIFRLYSTGSRRFSAKHLLSSVHIVDYREGNKVDSRSKPRVFIIKDDVSLIESIGSRMTTLRISKMSQEIMAKLPPTLTHMRCNMLIPSDDPYVFPYGLETLVVNLLAQQDNIMLPNTITKLDIMYISPHDQLSRSLPLKLQYLTTNVVIDKGCQLPISLIAIRANKIHKDVNLKLLHNLTTIMEYDKSNIDMTRYPSSVTNIGQVTFTKDIELPPIVENMEITVDCDRELVDGIYDFHTMAKYKNIRYMSTRFTTRVARNDLHIVLNFSLFTNLYSISVTALSQIANTVRLIDLPPTLKSIFLVAKQFNLNDLLLLNCLMDVIRIHAESFVYDDEVVDLRKFIHIHTLVLRASNGIELNRLICGPLMDIDLKMTVDQLNNITYFPVADDIYIDIEYNDSSKSETKQVLAKLCTFLSPNTRNIMVNTRYHINLKCIRNLIGNKWEVVDND